MYFEVSRDTTFGSDDPNFRGNLLVEACRYCDSLGGWIPTHDLSIHLPGVMLRPDCFVADPRVELEADFIRFVEDGTFEDANTVVRFHGERYNVYRWNGLIDDLPEQLTVVDLANHADEVPF